LPRLERLGILLGLVVAGLGLSAYVPLPSPVLAIRPPGALSPISIVLTPARQVSLVVAFLTCVAVDGIVRADERLAGVGFARSIPFWVLPALLVLGAFAVYERLSGTLSQALGLLGTAALLAILVVAQLHTLDPKDRWFEVARLGLNAASYGLALAVFVAAYRLPARHLLAPATVALVSTALALGLLETTRASNRRIWGSALLVGLIMAEVAWALSPGIFPPMHTGLVLLLVLYAATGTVQQQLWGRLRAQVALEFAIVAAAVLALLVRFGA